MESRTFPHGRGTGGDTRRSTLSKIAFCFSDAATAPI